jgi:hypothetical protein
MSLETKIGRAVLDLSDLIKTNVVSDIARARSEKQLSLTDAELQALANLVTSSVEKTIRNGVDGITRLVR